MTSWLVLPLRSASESPRPLALVSTSVLSETMASILAASETWALRVAISASLVPSWPSLLARSALRVAISASLAWVAMAWPSASWRVLELAS
jgi:hypothetical protein